VAAVETPDDLTVVVKFDGPKPYPYQPFTGGTAPILQKAQFEACVGAAAASCVEQNSKPIGTGLALAAGTADDRAAAIAGMRRLNRAAAERLVAAGSAVHAVTDVTGYGLAGHSWEMAERSGVRIVIDTAGIVAYPGALAAADAGTRTGGDPRNRDYLAGHLASSAAPGPEALCFDPQTSGGLLASVDPGLAKDLIADGWWRVGDVVAGDPTVELR
jgi:selenophosphate synthase